MKSLPYILFHGALLAVAVFLVSFKPAASFDCSSCSINGHKLYGKIQIVDVFPDVKVQIVDVFPDLKVQEVDVFPDACGKWQYVDVFPDVKIQLVDVFPDVKVQIVDVFPGCK
jgi:hypothetical protein